MRFEKCEMRNAVSGVTGLRGDRGEGEGDGVRVRRGRETRGVGGDKEKNGD
ncbi:MAG: hypothetical protein R2727_00355 [Bacteroidales bacterium]